MYTIDYILNKAKENGMNSSELDMINKAYKLVDKLYSGETRLNNEPYIEHPLTVAGIVTDLNADSTTIIAALLHGTITNDKLKEEDITKDFKEQISNIVSNLSKIDKLKLNNYNESSCIYLRKVLVGLSEDVRVLIIKLADRLDDMRSAYVLPSDEQKRMTNETMEVLIPIAHRLGINSIKSELEDLCLRYSKPDVYDEILEKLDGTREELSSSLEDMKNSISEILTDHGMTFEVKARVKSVYSIYTKLSTGRKWSDIYDILAMRLIVPTEEDCYLAVGLIHAKYRPIPKRFKDYIAMPKENMYQSLHTSVFGVDGHVFEIQLRTPEMDEIAEHGIASHWSYKEHGTKAIQNVMEQKLELFRNTIDISQNETSDEIFAKNMEEELLSKLIYVFTPKGDVMELPEGSTPIDFAYRIHSGVGDKTVGAIVNDNIVPLDYELQDGDIIKINTNNSGKPNKDWLNFVKTPQAKNKIKSYFSKKDRNINIERGKDLLEKEAKRNHLNYNELFTDTNINKIITDLKLKDFDDLLLSIGTLRYTAIYIINLINQDKKDLQDIMLDKVIKAPDKSENYKNDIIVAGTDNIRVTLAKCCNPIPGDQIIGYITKGEGVSVHKTDCHNVKNLSQRLIDVEWNTFGTDKLFSTNLIIKTNSLNNHVLDIVTAASVRGVSISSIKDVVNNNSVDYDLVVKVKNKNDLSLFIENLTNLKFVLKVER
jgi:GTP diphosphokinase / guanosine-3',5'-bis(diphosphate) 3'-diphosphatase